MIYCNYHLCIHRLWRQSDYLRRRCSFRQRGGRSGSGTRPGEV